MNIGQQSGRLRRRELFGSALGAAGVVVLASCGAPPTVAPAQPTPTTATARAAPQVSAPASGAPASSGASTASSAPANDTPVRASSGPATPTANVKRGGTLLIGQDFGPQDLDPGKSSAWASTNIEELIYTGLLRWSPKMELEPDLATSYEQVDATTFAFTLRDGVTFHNGAPFGPEDVKYTFERILDPATASPYIAIFSSIKSVEIPSPKTVKFTLSQPFAPFLRYLATIPYGAIIPRGATAELKTKPIGTGPFKFVEHLLDQEVRLERFDKYYEAGLPYLDKVTFKLLGDDTSISSAIRSKTIDITWLKDPKVAQSVAASVAGLKSSQGVSSRYLPIHFDLKAAPFNDVRVRRAMSVALNRKAIAQTVLGSYGSVGSFLPPSQLAGYTGDGNDLPYYKQDIEQAKQLLKDAGLSNLMVPEFKIVASNQLDVQCAQVMKEQWAAAGITVNILPMEVGAILTDWAAGKYKMATVGGVWTPDPSAEVERFLSTAPFGKAMGINDPELDALITQGRIESDPAKRVAIYKQIEQRALDQAYIIVPYTYPLRWELQWSNVQGYEVMPSNARLSVRKTWLEG